MQIASIDRYGSYGLDVAVDALRKLETLGDCVAQRRLLQRLHETITSRNPAVAEAAIPAAVRVGDISAIPLIEAVASGRGAGRKWESVRKLAESAVIQLEDLRQRTAEASTLLRPADSLPDESVLMRPAAASSTPEMLLLRPEAAPEDG